MMTTPFERSGATPSPPTPPTVVVAATTNVWLAHPNWISFNSYHEPPGGLALVVRGQAAESPAPWFDRWAFVPTAILRHLPPLAVGTEPVGSTAIATLDRDPFDEPWFRAAAAVTATKSLQCDTGGPEPGVVWLTACDPFPGVEFVSGTFGRGVAGALRGAAFQIKRAAKSPPAGENGVQ